MYKLSASHRNVAVALVLATSFLAGCGPDSAVLARVGDSEITEMELVEFVDRLPEHVRSKGLGIEADREHLNSMIDRELLFLEARSRGLHTSAVVTRQIGNAEGKRLIERYYREVIAPRVEILPEDIERAFHSVGFDRERLLNRIVVRGDERDARAVFEQLEAGKAFTDLAREYADNDRNADEIGRVGWIGLTGLKRLSVTQREFMSLQIGEPKLIRVAPGSWQIIRFEEDRESQISNYEDDLRKIVGKEQYWRRTEEQAELLNRDHGTRYHPEAVQVLVKRYEERRNELYEAEKAQPLYTFATGDTITAGDFVTRVREQRGTSAVEDSAANVRIAKDALLHPYLFEHEARKRGWHEEEGFVTWRAHTFDGLLLDYLMQTEVEDHLSFSEDELRAYYEGNREDFHVDERVRIEEVHAQDEATARQFRDDIAGGTTFTEILQRPGAASFGKHRLGGRITLHPHQVRSFPVLVEAAFAAREGELIGPVRLEEQNAYAILRVLERKEYRIRPFEEARKAVEQHVRVTRKDKLVSAFIQSLRDKYEGQVAIFDDRLEQRHTDQ